MIWFIKQILGIGMDLQVVPIHKHPQYKEQCCNLINDEWKRSTTARMRSLDSSCDNLPTNLILLKENKVIGHCKLSVIPSMRNACFVESVVIDKLLRGNGYGKYLMITAEEYCRNILKLEVIYLSTKGQELFYSKLGYNVCPPVSIYGGSFSSESVLQCEKIENVTNPTFPCPPPLPKYSFTTNTKTYMKKVL
ncbi:hypothetical protein PPYR_01970 [Photinus pyralis]|uniref:N-acetyltransferase domain-containing protein n=2 Tax=Photinus pyralis TaxID=7054 RepID=A0A1Y1NE24_PHOPY|nr:hypothetical protein PPYR_01970 [Photinus pyralis]